MGDAKRKMKKELEGSWKAIAAGKGRGMRGGGGGGELREVALRLTAAQQAYSDFNNKKQIGT